MPPNDDSTWPLVLEIDLKLALQVKEKQRRGRLYRDSLQVPKGAAWGVIWTPDPIGTRTDASPDGHHTACAIVGEDTVRVWMIPTARLAGGRGLLLELFGLVLEAFTDRGPLWVFDITGLGDIHFQPWVLRAWKPGSPLPVEILCPPDLPRGRPSIVSEMRPWRRKTYDTWQASAGQAMTFLHAFEQHLADGRPKKSRAEALAEMATLGLEYLRAHPDMTVEDLQHRHLASAALRSPEAHSQFMNRHRLKIPDVRRAIATFLARDFS